MDICGCCEGIDSETPVNFRNLPSQTLVSYRIGTHSKFKESMLAALARADYPALRSLSTRDDDDFTIACLDGVATALDVLTFYQERYVNEHYLMTSTERRSVVALAHLIGYTPSPGVAAATHLAFTLQTNPADPVAESVPITVPAATRVQSVPGQDEKPQVFETTEDTETRAEWNAVAARNSIAYAPEFGDRDVYIEGVNNNIAAGDAVLLVGQHRVGNPGSERWDVRVVKAVREEPARQRTRLIWNSPLGHIQPKILPSETDVRLYVFRRRTRLFGHNAPDPRLMSVQDNQLGTLLAGEGVNQWWAHYAIQSNQIDLANPEDKVTAGSWIALVSNADGFGTPDLPGYTELYRAEKVSSTARTDYGMSAKITRIKPDTAENISRFGLRETLALVASEELAIHRRPLHYPVYGGTVDLERRLEGLKPGRYLSISGQRQRLKLAAGLSRVSAEGKTINEGDSLQLAAAPEKLIGGMGVQLNPQAFGALMDSRNTTTQLILQLVDRDGSPLTVQGVASDWHWDQAEDDPVVAEIARIDPDEDAIAQGRDHTTLQLGSALRAVYRRESVRINFNVAAATHGETVSEILGDGDARKSDQAFVLKQTPLTYVSADTPSGAQAEMEVRVNELRWSETRSLYRAESDARVYQLRNQDDGGTEVRFGDGIEGARLPSGSTNVRAVYRKGVGVAANLGRGTLTTLLQRPLGVAEVSNTEPATGGADPEAIGNARRNAPLTVLTLDRAVSVQDYRNYARAFAGVAKAHALWIGSGPSRGIYITLAGIDGAEIPESSSTYVNLMNSLRRYGDPLIPLGMVNHRAAAFALGMAVKINEAAQQDTVLANLESALRTHFSFDQRDFGQHVSRDEVLAVAHNVEHIEAVRITRLFKVSAGASDTVEPIIAAHLPVASLAAAPQAAELLTLSDQPMELGVFS